MKQEPFKTTYLQIQLNREQKNKIWQQIETASNFERRSFIEKKKVFYKSTQFSTRAAICASVLLLSGVTVLAAGEFSVPDRIAEAIGLFTNQKQSPSDEEKTLYTQFGNALNQEITLEYGTLKLDAALYDSNYLLIPFCYLVHQNVKGNENIPSGTDFLDTNTYLLEKLQCQKDIDTIRYSIGKDTKIYNGIDCSYTIINPEIKEDGIITGILVLKTDTETSFQEGKTIQLLREVEQTQVEVLTTFQLGKALEQRTLSIHEAQTKTLEQMQISIDSITLSPISLYCNLKSKNIQFSIDVVLKNNNIVALSPNGSACYLNSDNKKQGHIFTSYQFFNKPISLDNAAGVRIRSENLEVFFPLEN